MLNTKTKGELKTLLDQMGKSFEAGYGITLDPGLVKEIAHKVIGQKIYLEVHERIKDLGIVDLTQLLLIMDEKEQPVEEVRTEKTIRRSKKNSDPSVN